MNQNKGFKTEWYCTVVRVKSRKKKLIIASNAYFLVAQTQHNQLRKLYIIQFIITVFYINMWKVEMAIFPRKVC